VIGEVLSDGKQPLLVRTVPLEARHNQQIVRSRQIQLYIQGEQNEGEQGESHSTTDRMPWVASGNTYGVGCMMHGRAR
jgi:hypothetical protein